MTRVRGQSTADPFHVPLPHGTEVTVRVERIVGTRRIPQGVVGRVVRAREGGFDVMIPSEGEVWYTRDELTPRKAGQIRFAQHREDAWQALERCVVLRTVVGSKAWGLADAASDTDVRGVFVLPFRWTLGLCAPPTDLTSADSSASYWELAKTVRQGIKADPNTLETLFLSSATPSDVMGEWLLEERDTFVSKRIFGSFGRYAVSQLGKLTRAQRLAEHREAVLEWLCEEPPPTLDAVAERLAKRSAGLLSPGDASHLAKTYIKQLYRSLFDQGLIDANEFGALVRYARAGGTRPEAARELRPKNAYNLLRLIALATGWLRDGHPTFVVSGTFRERLLDIKHGRVPLESVLRDAERMVPELEVARERSGLPEEPDVRRLDRLLKRIGEEVARRCLENEPGAWGRDAPPAPDAELEVS